MTKIRPAKLAEIEAEDFSQFPSLAYAKGFILIYGKFLNVDVTPYLEAFEGGGSVTVDGYSYLQDNPAPAPRRVEVVRKMPAGNRSSLMPLVIGLVIAIAGFSLLRVLMDVRRLKPSERDRQALAQATATPFAGSAAPALPATTPGPASAGPAATPAVAAVAPPEATPAPTVAMAALPPGPTEGEPEVRRAMPVNPSEVAAVAAASPSPSASPSPDVNRFEVRPVRKTYVRVTVDGGGRPTERWVDPSEGLSFRGKRIAIKVLNPSDVVIRKNGKIVGSGDVDVRIE